MTYMQTMNTLHEHSRTTRAMDGFDDGKVPTTILVMPGPEMVLPPLVFANGINDVHRAKLRTLPPLLRAVGAQAVILCSDSLSLNVENFCKEFDVPMDHTFLHHYERIMDAKFDGTMAKLPSHLRIDVLVTSIKGPSIPLEIIVDTYTRGQNGEVVYSRMPGFKQGHGMMNIIPDWWETSVQ